MTETNYFIITWLMTGWTSLSVSNDMNPSSLTLFTNDAKNSESVLTVSPGSTSLTLLQNLPDRTDCVVVLYQEPSVCHLSRKDFLEQNPDLKKRISLVAKKPSTRGFGAGVTEWTSNCFNASCLETNLVVNLDSSSGWPVLLPVIAVESACLKTLSLIGPRTFFSAG